jgi:trehalose 6-phosphate synthase/phosphatase
MLTALAAEAKNTVIVVSGRTERDLDRWFGRVPRLGLAAEHGVRIRMPGSNDWQGPAASAEWKATIRPILDHFVERTPGSCVEEKEYALVWHFRTAEPEFANWLAGELVTMLDGMLAETELRAFRGNKIVEIKPLWANKGSLVGEVLRNRADTEFVLAIGDDRTDEDLFGALPDHAWSVHVGLGPSKAKYRVAGIAAVRDLLRSLTS